MLSITSFDNCVIGMLFDATYRDMRDSGLIVQCMEERRSVCGIVQLKVVRMRIDLSAIAVHLTYGHSRLT